MSFTIYFTHDLRSHNKPICRKLLLPPVEDYSANHMYPGWLAGWLIEHACLYLHLLLHEPASQSVSKAVGKYNDLLTTSVDRLVAPLPVVRLQGFLQLSVVCGCTCAGWLQWSTVLQNASYLRDRLFTHIGTEARRRGRQSFKFLSLANCSFV